MAPLLRPGDSVTVEPVRLKLSLRPGEIVVLAGEQKPVIHHFLYWTLKNGRPHLRTTGRTGRAVDGLWPSDALIGRAVARDRGNVALAGVLPSLWLSASLAAPLLQVLLGRMERQIR